MSPLPVSRIALAVRLRTFHDLPVVVTHLASGRQNVIARQKEVESLLRWTHKFGASQILLGDFNAKPDGAEVQPLMAEYREVWVEGSRRGVASGAAGTHGDHRIDYIF